MKRFLPVAAAVVVACVGAASAQPATTFVIEGRGWGHGIGMGQYGAQGFALDGRTYREILAHYYRGTTLGTRSETIRVRLAAGRSSLTIGSDAAFKGGSANLGAGTWRVTAPPSGGLRLTRGSTTRRVAGRTTFEAGSAFLELNGPRYRGTIQLRRSSGRVWAVNIVSLNSYVRGVVPREMPTSWHAEALKAQSVAARTYALAAGGHCGWFGTNVMCPDTSDQVYGGRDAETTASNAAVEATGSRVVLSGGALATTFFFSTSGGRTANVAHEWGGNQPYLVSVNDPFDSLSPHHRWGPGDAEDDCPGGGRDCVWTGGALKDRLGSRVQGALVDMTVTRNGSSRVEHVRATGTAGATNISGATMRSVLGLRSTWFSVDVLRLTGAGTIDRGEGRTLSFLVRGISNAKLQRRRAGGSWVDIGSPEGSGTRRVSPTVTTYYRLWSPRASTSRIRVAVRP
jgi:stage II sporulation protein D